MSDFESRPVPFIDLLGLEVFAVTLKVGGSVTIEFTGNVKLMIPDRDEVMCERTIYTPFAVPEGEKKGD